MDLSKVFPSEVIAWLLHYGLFLALCLFGGLVVLVLFRPFWLWFTGQSEALERLRKLTELQGKALFEMEMLNKTLSIPLKKSAGATPEAPKDTAVDAGEFLAALKKTRKRLREGE